MDGSSSSNGNPRNGKRASYQSFIDNPREPKRGVGIAKLEKMRAEEEMKENYYLQDPFSRTAHISGPAVQIQGMISYGTSGNMSGLFINDNLLFARPPSTSFLAPGLQAASGVNTSNTAPTASYVNPSNSEPTASNVNPSNTEPTTLQLLPDHKEDEHADSKREGNHTLSVEPTCKNSNDPEDLDLDLKL